MYLLGFIAAHSVPHVMATRGQHIPLAAQTPQDVID